MICLVGLSKKFKPPKAM